MPNVVGHAHLLKPGQPRGVKRVAHRKSEGVIGQHGLNGIGQGGEDVLEKRRGGRARLIGMDGNHGFTAEIVDGRKFEVVPGISQGRQVFEIQMQELAGPLLFVATRRRPRRSRELTHTVVRQHALHRAVSDVELNGDAVRAQSSLSQLENAARDRARQLGWRTMRSPTLPVQAGQVGGSVAFPPAAEYFAGNPEVGAQRSQRNSLLMEGHQLGSKHRVISHSTHALAPCVASYR